MAGSSLLAYVRASNAVHRRTTASQVDALIKRSRARLEREMNGAGVTAWQPYVKPASFYADAARRGARASRAAALGGR